MNQAISSAALRNLGKQRVIQVQSAISQLSTRWARDFGVSISDIWLQAEHSLTYSLSGATTQLSFSLTVFVNGASALQITTGEFGGTPSETKAHFMNLLSALETAKPT